MNVYRVIGAYITLYYTDNVFMSFHQEGEDKVIFDGIKHLIELYEEDLDLTKFEKLKLDEDNIYPFNHK